MPQRWAVTDRLVFGETVFSELPGAKSIRERRVRGLGDRASCCFEAGFSCGHSRWGAGRGGGGAQSCRGQGCGQGSDLDSLPPTTPALKKKKIEKYTEALQATVAV